MKVFFRAVLCWALFFPISSAALAQTGAAEPRANFQPDQVVSPGTTSLWDNPPDYAPSKYAPFALPSTTSDTATLDNAFPERGSASSLALRTDQVEDQQDPNLQICLPIVLTCGCSLSPENPTAILSALCIAVFALNTWRQKVKHRANRVNPLQRAKPS